VLLARQLRISLVDTTTIGRNMNNIIENNEDQFANCQISRDLRANSDVMEPESRGDGVNVIEQLPDPAPEEFPAPIGKLLGLSITSSGKGRTVLPPHSRQERRRLTMERR
jgi:hypothetical protein